jgi:hypothetical protein
MTTLNQSNKATAYYTSVPTLTQLIDDLTSLRDSVGAPGSSTLTVVEVTDPINGGFVATGVETPIALIFEWDAT